MEVVYLDQVFAVNFLVDYCIVLAAARVSDVILRRGRYVLAALAGAVYAALTVLPGFGWLALLPVKAAAGLVMALIAFGSERRFWRCAVIFFGTAALFGGAVFALSAAAGGTPGQALRHVTGRVLIPTFALCYAVVATVFRARLRSAERGVVAAVLTAARCRAIRPPSWSACRARRRARVCCPTHPSAFPADFSRHFARRLSWWRASRRRCSWRSPPPRSRRRANTSCCSRRIQLCKLFM